MPHHEDRQTKWPALKAPKLDEPRTPICFTSRGDNLILLVDGRSFELTKHEAELVRREIEKHQQRRKD